QLSRAVDSVCFYSLRVGAQGLGGILDRNLAALHAGAALPSAAATPPMASRTSSAPSIAVTCATSARGAHSTTSNAPTPRTAHSRTSVIISRAVSPPGREL